MDVLDFIERRMLQVLPRERATCGQVVETLEKVTVNVLEDEKYTMSPIPGNSKRPATDFSIRSLSQTLYFDPVAMQVALTDEHSQVEISENDASEMRAGNAAATQQPSTVAPPGSGQPMPVDKVSGYGEQAYDIDLRPSRVKGGINVVHTQSSSPQSGAVSSKAPHKQKRRWYQWRLGGGSDKS